MIPPEQIAHDAPGFGFTDRPNGDTPPRVRGYSSENNVGIGFVLLKRAFSSSEDETMILMLLPRVIP